MASIERVTATCLAILLCAILSPDDARATEAHVASPPPPAATENVTMTVGEMRDLRYAATATMRISRRGIVDVYHGGGESWTLSALRGGIVLVEAVDSETGATILPRLLVTVEARKDDETGAGTGSAWPLPAWICSERGIACGGESGESGEINGTTSSLDWFIKASAHCERRDGCLMRVRLTATGRAKALAAIRARLSAEHAVEWESDTLVVRAPCDDQGRSRRSLDGPGLLGDAVRSGLIAVACHGDAATPSYRLRAHVYLVEESAASRLGFDGKAELTAAGPGGHLTATWLTKLQSLEAERDVEAIGRPVARLLPGRTLEIVSGGEFQTYESDPDDHGLRTAWKQHGLSLKIRATPIGPRSARLDVVSSLKVRAPAGGSALSVSSIDSHFDVALGQPTLACALDLESRGQDSRGSALGGWPIIGPLFRVSGDETARARLMIWLELDLDSTSDPSLPEPMSRPLQP